eukprot:TRINITY_DN3979_c0_g1_i1.p1 TRINITY_DN3979_c0_g1~~TRINITY_DN3979_c0_g1_i1.p1  ORF type:complete len:937 (+),score=121.48 TRINITY_DN3979_c0_g1_i1:2238-5048(+)
MVNIFRLSISSLLKTMMAPTKLHPRSSLSIARVTQYIKIAIEYSGDQETDKEEIKNIQTVKMTPPLVTENRKDLTELLKRKEQPISNLKSEPKDENVKVHKLEEIAKSAKGWIFVSENMPNRLLKGVWIVGNLGERIGKIPSTEKTCKIESSTFTTPTGKKFSLWLDLKSRAVEKHNCYGVYFKYMSPLEDKQEDRLDLTIYIKAKWSMGLKRKHMIHKSTYKTFDSYETEWGNAKFLKTSLFKQEGLDKILVIQFKIQPLLIDPEATSIGSKVITGYVGLINHGTTCYVNSMLQSLFTINEFRRAIFATPTDEDEMETIPYALQRVFYNLQHSNEPVPIAELLYSFGWKKEDFTMQHDIQEFKCFLADVFDKIEHKLKGTEYENVFAKLFQGRIKSCIRCVDVDVASEKEETFSDIQLNVRGCKDLYESFEQYIACEDLIGDNKYQTEYNGLQNAQKATRFELLPPVLQLHLKRFEYSGTHLSKVYDKFEFFPEVDLNRFVPHNPQGINYTYQLHSVVVHRGRPSSGHYFAYIWDHETAHWLKFNDTYVNYVDEEEAIKENFGGKYKTVLVNDASTAVLEKIKDNRGSAYMLIYIRKDLYDKLQRKFSSEEIPARLVSRLEKEKRFLEKHREHCNKYKGCVVVNIVSEEMIRGWTGPSIAPGLINTNKERGIKHNTRYRMRLPTLEDITLKEYVSMFAQDAGLEEYELVAYKFEIEKYWLGIRRFTDAEWRRPVKDITPKTSWGVFMMSKGKNTPLFVKRESKEIAVQKRELSELINFFEFTKRPLYITDLDHELPEWKQFEAAHARPDSGNSPDAKTDVIAEGEGGSENLLFIKWFNENEEDKSKTLRLIKAITAKSGESLKDIVENVIPTAKDTQLFEELNSSNTKEWIRLIKDDAKVKDIKDGAIIICAEKKGEETVKELISYLNHWINGGI